MTTTTIVVWLTGAPSQQESQAINAQVEIMKQAGKTDGVPQFGYSSAARVIQRTWTTVDDAKEYLAYINGYDNVISSIVPLPSPQAG